MPKMILEIENKKVEFNIIPINHKTKDEIINRLPGGAESRTTFLSHIIKEPKMTLNEWNNVPSLIITNILKGVEYYISQITTLQSQIAAHNLAIEVLSNEIESLSAYAKEYPDDHIINQLDDLYQQLESNHNDRDALLNILDEFVKDKKPLILSKNVLDRIK